jgi:DNA polymerase III psi subunit
MMTDQKFSKYIDSTVEQLNENTVRIMAIEKNQIEFYIKLKTILEKLDIEFEDSAYVNYKQVQKLAKINRENK